MSARQFQQIRRKQPESGESEPQQAYYAKNKTSGKYTESVIAKVTSSTAPVHTHEYPAESGHSDEYQPTQRKNTHTISNLSH